MTLQQTAEAATFAWDDLSARLERFIATWDTGGEPTLVEFLPPEPPTHRRMVLIELVKVDLEQRTQRGRKKPLETYTTEFPELLENGEPPCDLIYEEYHIRRTAGDNVSPRDYYQRFPRSADALRRLMGTADFSVTTQVCTGRKIEGFAAGQKVDDFDLLVELGKGAFGSVFLARQVSMQRLVALKLSADKGNEPQTLATLEHPNIIRVYDQRTLPGQKVRLLYMQFAPGGTLAEVCKHVRLTAPAARNGSLLMTAVREAVEKSGTGAADTSRLERRLAAAGWPETVCRLGIQLAYALDHAHRQGVLHRDVKPANVLLTADGSPKLADFNISFCSQLDGASPAAYFGGSLAYMSPEQIEACNPAHEREPQDLDGRSDLYSLAVVLWELLYGERPFYEDDMEDGWTAMLTAMAKRRRQDKPSASSVLRDPVAMRLEHVLRKTLSPDPAQRPPDGAAMAREIMLCLNPRAWDLVNDLKSGWRHFARQFPKFSLFPTNLPIFLAAGGFNLFYNAFVYLPEAVEPLDKPRQEAFVNAFWMSAQVLNPVLYTLGSVLVIRWAVPMARALQKLNRGESVDENMLAFARRRAVLLGHGVAAIGFGLWIVAGIAFPVFIWAVSGIISLQGLMHFMLSMLACGIISCCLPFLATTWLSVRVFIPALLANSTPDPSERQRLIELGRQASIYLFTSPVAPLMALLLVMFSADGQWKQTAMVILVIVAIFGFGAAFWTWQRIRADLEALSVVTRPPDMIGTTSESVDTF
ncbi:MAG TPA: serine/threonine-protein kinase [Pirellulaceae bacterium]|jgi:serine/threonine protein kinase